MCPSQESKHETAQREKRQHDDGDSWFAQNKHALLLPPFFAVPF